MLTNYRSKENLICTIKPYLQDSGINREAADWLIKNIKYITDDTMPLMDYLERQKTGHDSEYLTLSIVLKFQNDFEEFVDMYDVKRDWL